MFVCVCVCACAGGGGGGGGAGGSTGMQEVALCGVLVGLHASVGFRCRQGILAVGFGVLRCRGG